MELLLYDQSYPEEGRVEDMFLRQYPSGGTYLYIGCGAGKENGENAILGEGRALAELRSY